MPKMIVSLDGVIINDVQLTKDRTSIGRRPYNDVVIDNLAVSGEHAVLQMSGGDVYLEDLNSTNGTYIDGKAVKKQLLENGNVVEIGKYKIRFLTESGYSTSAPHAAFSSQAELRSSMATAPMPMLDESAEGAPAAAIKVLSGAALGREVALVKVVTTIGKPGVAVASITKRAHGFVVAHVEGASLPTLNGVPIDTEPLLLRNGDLLELAGTKMQFIQH